MGKLFSVFIKVVTAVVAEMVAYRVHRGRKKGNA